MIEEKRVTVSAINERIKNELIQAEAPETENANAHVDTKSRIYIFESRSIPIAVLRSFAADIDTLGSDTIRLVFRSFPRNFLHTFLQKDQAGTKGDGLVNAKIIVGEKIFDRYRVDRVPAVVFDPDPTTSNEDWLLVYGAVSLHQALTLFHRESGRQELNKPRLNARFLCCLALLCLSLAIGMTIPQRLTITKTDSVKYHLFWEIDRKAIQKGDYVRLPLFDPGVGCNPCSIVKRIGCLPGDRLAGEDMNYYCNGKYLGQCMTGKHIAPFRFTGQVPPGKVFLVGDRDNSYDSRYFGFKSINDIETVLHPLF